MRHILRAAVGCLLALTAVNPVWADTRAVALKNLARYQQYAGDPVDNFDMYELYQWQTLGPDYLAVWAAVNKVYLLKVSQPCSKLEYANGIAVTTEMVRKVTRGFDYVNFDAQHCQIIEIRPINYKAMLKADEEHQ